MRTEDIERFLDAGRLPDQEIPFHARRLKAGLLAAPDFSRSRSSSAGVVSTITASLMNKKRIVFAGVFVAVFAFVLFTTDKLGTAPAPIAQAQELVKAAQEQVATVSPEAVSEIEAELQVANIHVALREALAAPDLRKMEPRPVTAEGWSHFSVIEPTDEDARAFLNTPPGEATDDPSIKVWLQYTDPKGREIMLGLDERNMPVARYVLGLGPQSEGYIPDESAR